ncbi:hypothetical protein MIR68_001261 [Amoeboaphelidium protococcarum]|nr:hypothetical protein MIR68_001261 [Amoeboaphelidium protococcarum]
MESFDSLQKQQLQQQQQQDNNGVIDSPISPTMLQDVINNESIKVDVPDSQQQGDDADQYPPQLPPRKDSDQQELNLQQQQRPKTHNPQIDTQTSTLLVLQEGGEDVVVPNEDPLTSGGTQQQQQQQLVEYPSSQDFPQLNFEQFLETMRSPESFALTRYFKSFLREFTRRRWTSDEKQRIVRDFMLFMTDRDRGKVLECQLYKSGQDKSPQLVDNFSEGLEKLVCIKLYDYLLNDPHDILVDKCLHYVILLHSKWITLDHFDISFRAHVYKWHETVEESTETQSSDLLSDQEQGSQAQTQGKRIDLARNSVEQQVNNAIKLALDELRKITEYKSARDKLISIVNCCKILLGFLEKINKSPSRQQQQHGIRSTQSEQSQPASPTSPMTASAVASADDLMPLLIYTIIKSHHLTEGQSIGHLYSHVMFISRFRIEDKLRSEAGYYLTCLNAAIGFIVGISYSSFTWSGGNVTQTQGEYDEKVAQSLVEIEDERLIPSQNEMDAARLIVKGENVDLQKAFQLDIRQYKMPTQSSDGGGKELRQSMSNASFTTNSSAGQLSSSSLNKGSKSTTFITPNTNSQPVVDRVQTLSRGFSGMLSKIFESTSSTSSQQMQSTNQPSQDSSAQSSVRNSPQAQQHRRADFKPMGSLRQTSPGKKASFTQNLYDAAVAPFVDSPSYPGQMVATPAVQKQSLLDEQSFGEAGALKDYVPQNTDYEMQIAMALSLSLQEEEQSRPQSASLNTDSVEQHQSQQQNQLQQSAEDSNSADQKEKRADSNLIQFSDNE